MSLKIFDHSRSAALLAAGMLLAAAAAFGSRPPAGTLAGRLLDGVGRPVAGAAVSLKGRITVFSASTVSAADGAFSFPEVPAGVYSLSVDKPGYEQLDRTVEAGPDGFPGLELILQAGTASTGPLGPADPYGLKTKDIFGGVSTGSLSAFNPALSVIAGGYYYHDGRGGDGADLLGRADGFPNSFESDKQGFNLGETELALSGSVDPYFDAWAILSVASEGIEVEEAYLQTRRLPLGLQLKAGKFKSGIGYINKQHSHQWDFADQALPYAMMFGGCLAETGLQVTWLAPLPFYLQVGLEALQGGNRGVASYTGPDDDHPYYERKAGPRLFTGFVKVSPDLGYDFALQGGLFGGHSLLHQEDFTWDSGEGAVSEALQGTATFWGTDWVFKYDAPYAYGRGDLTVQGEYIYRRKDLEVAAAAADATPSRRFDQDGLYAQAVYGFAPRWTAGLRCDAVGLTNRVDLSGFGRLAYGTAVRWSTDLTLSLTEFSRLRLQYEQLKLVVDGGRDSFGEMFLQYQVSLGAHGAHKF